MALVILIVIVAFLAARVFAPTREPATGDDSGESYGDGQTRVERQYPVMGTWASVTLYGPTADAGFAADQVYAAFKIVEKTCNRFDPTSELSKLNATAGKAPFQCGELLWDLLMASKTFYEISDGAFDVTITPLMKLWGFYRKQSRLPSKAEVQKALANVGFDKIEFNAAKKTVFFKNPNLQIDLGGIAKGYAVDYAYKAVQSYNIERGLINLGGNLRCFPEPPPGKEFYAIGVRDPFVKGEVFGAFHAVDAAVATSGNYEKYVVIDGKRYTHIMNPKTGMPVIGSVAVTVTAPSATWCDALSTTFFIQGPGFARSFRRDHANVQALFFVEKPDQPKSADIIKMGPIWDTLVSD